MRDPLEWVVIDDFSSGIWRQRASATDGGGTDTNWLPHGKAPLGSASDALNCVATADGSLGPGPLIEEILAPGLTSYTTGWTVVGLASFGPVLFGTPTYGPDELHVCLEANGEFRWLRVRVFDDTFLADTLKSISAASWGAGRWGASLVTTRMNPAAPTSPGNPVVVCSWRAANDSNMFISVFPDPSAPTTNSVYDIDTTRYGSLVAHQNRLVLLEGTAFPHGTPPGSGGASPTNDIISFTDPNNYNLGTQKQVFVAEHPNGYGAYGSISTGELFLVKHRGGGVLVQGDIADPTVIRLPGVISTGNVGCRAASTYRGLFYATLNRGVCLWRGSDTSEPVSEQLPERFWQADGSDVINNERVHLEEWNDWLMVSNGWLLDLRSMGWFRVASPMDRKPFWLARGFNSTWCYAMTHDDATRILIMNRNRYAHRWTWRSNPILLSRSDRTAYVREVIVQASNPSYSEDSTLLVRVTNDSDGTSAQNVITIPAGARATWSQRINVHVPCIASCSVYLDAIGGGTNEPAPVVHQIRLGTTTRMRPPSMP